MDDGDATTRGGPPADADIQSDPPAPSGGPAGSDDPIRIEVRPGEVVITIRTSALTSPDLVAHPVVRALQPSLTRGASLARAPGAPTRIGLTEVPADKYGDGYRNFWLRTDLKPDYLGVLQKTRALGGVATSSGAIRELSAGAGPGRSKTSFHYTGRAIDLFIATGMQGANDRYLIQRDGGTDANPEWRVLCVSTNPILTDAAFDASLLKTGEVEYLVWKKGKGVVPQKRTATYFSLSDILKGFGWVRIPARSDWMTNYLSSEWWHFQHHKHLVDGVSTFGDELRDVYSPEKVAASGLALHAVFSGRSFRA